jgi:hypothetical protein
MRKRSPPWWFYTILSVGSFTAAVIYFNKAYRSGPLTRSLVMALIYLGLAILWFVTSYFSWKTTHTEDDKR